MKKKPRRVYKDADGNKLPSVTEILGGLGWKYAPLMAWANKIGREGRTLSEGSRDAMEIGSIAHDLIEDWILARPQRERGTTPVDLWEPAVGCLHKFVAWWRAEHWSGRFHAMCTEIAMVDRERGYGGTADLVGLLDGEPIVLDYKTGKSVYAETAIQLAAYAELWSAHGHAIEVDGDDEPLSQEQIDLRKEHRRIERAGIIHVPVDGPVTFVEIPSPMREAAHQIWQDLLSMQHKKRVYDVFGKELRKMMKREEPEDDKKRVPF